MQEAARVNLTTDSFFVTDGECDRDRIEICSQEFLEHCKKNNRGPVASYPGWFFVFHLFTVKFNLFTVLKDEERFG
jgi:hypothetical protein